MEQKREEILIVRANMPPPKKRANAGLKVYVQEFECFTK